MTPVEKQFAELKVAFSNATISALPSGANLVEVPNYPLPPGWSLGEVKVLFLAPPGFPGAQPDCFWVEPSGLRLANGGTPEASNDSNPIPGVDCRATTWFSWHLQAWNPNTDSLMTYLNVIRQRLHPPR